MKKKIALILLSLTMMTGAVAQAQTFTLEDPASPAAILSQAKSSKYIGIAKAKKIALAKAKGKNARITEIELDREDGVMVYEGEMVDSKYEYDFEINARTGKIIEWDREYRD